MINFERNAKPATLYQAICWKGHDMDFEPARIPEPTDAPPGSKAKIEVMRRRLLAGEHLRHPDDVSTAATIEEQTIMLEFVRDHSNRTIYANRKA
jgi:hypothetical protein